MPRPADAKVFPRAGIATPHYLASAAGLSVLARGGNAMDAALAANLALGVVTPYSCGLGGDIFAMVWDGRLHGYLGAGRAPQAATVDAVTERVGGATMPHFGPQTVTVPGAVRGWFDLLDRWGTRSFGDLAADASRLACDGFTVSAAAGEFFALSGMLYRRSPTWNAAYGGTAPGTVLRQPGMAATYARLAEHGPDGFYRGAVAEAMVEALADEGGLHTLEDLAAHAGEWCDPLTVAYRDSVVAQLPPPTQGVTVLEGLRMLDRESLPSDGLDRQHLLIEVMKTALDDRDAFVSDPAWMPTPPEALLADDFVASRRAMLDPARARVAGVPVAPDGGTIYLCAADADGLLVSLIQSNFTEFGSGVVVEDWGVNLQNRGASFTLDPEHVNAIAPGKRPMHTLIPAMALRDGRPWLVFGNRGGESQAQFHAQLLARLVDDGDDPQRALAAPRWSFDRRTGELLAEERFGAEVLDGLAARGHRVRAGAPYESAMGFAHAITVRDDGYAVATEPRAEGAGLGL